MSSISEELKQEYLHYASALIGDWMGSRYPHSLCTGSMPYGHRVPFGMLVVSTKAQPETRHGPDGGSFRWVPTLQFWHDDSSLMEVRGTPDEWEPRSWDDSAYEDPALGEVFTAAYRNMISQWTGDNFPCCSRYESRTANGLSVRGRVYSRTPTTGRTRRIRRRSSPRHTATTTRVRTTAAPPSAACPGSPQGTA